MSLKSISSTNLYSQSNKYNKYILNSGKIKVFCSYTKELRPINPIYPIVYDFLFKIYTQSVWFSARYRMGNACQLRFSSIGRSLAGMDDSARTYLNFVFVGCDGV